MSQHRRTRILAVAVIAACAALQATQARQRAEDPLFTRMREEADASRVSETVFHLTDAIGPRIVSSPALQKAELWLVERLRDYGLQNVRIEPNPAVNVGGTLFDPPGWSWGRAAVQQLTPWPQTLTAVPVLYSPATSGPQRGGVVIAPLPRPSEGEVDAFIARHRGRLRATFLLTSDRDAPMALNASPVHRYNLDELREFQSAAAPPSNVTRAVPPSATPSTAQAGQPPAPAEMFKQHSRVFDFLREEGVLGLVGPARRGSEGGTLFVSGPPAPPGMASAPPPMADLAPEHFNRVLRLIRRGVPVQLEMDLQSQFHANAGTENVVAEMRGRDAADEVVLVGAHLDSWHGATGATDNAIGVATVLEAMRILTSLGVPLRRSVQVAFWGGEEIFNLAGSRGYTQRYLLDRAGQPTAAHQKLSGYLNLDYGSGRIRGIYLQGNENLKPIFDAWLPGIGDGTLVATLRTTLGSDQASFERIGIPGLSFIQDPLNYEQRTHHTNMDEPDYISFDDARQSAAIVAAIVYRIANADALLPRRR